MRKEKQNIQNNDALKGFLFRAYNARRCTNVGQALPDNRKNLVENNSCVAGPEQKLLRTSVSLNQLSGHALTYKGCSLRPLRSLAHRATPSAPLAGEVRRSRVGGLLKNISTTSEKVKARMRGLSLFNLINPSRGLRASSPARGEADKRFGFTLIELLVVVLIIGILAAVALPQYQRAVRKSWLIQLITAATSIKQAEDLYYLSNGEYTNRRNNLDITLQEPNVHITMPSATGTNNSPSILGVTDDRLPGVLIYFGMTHSGNTTWNNARFCYALKKDPLANELCQHVTGRTTPTMSDPSEGDHKYRF